MSELKNFRLLPQEGVDGSGGVGGFQPPPKIEKIPAKNEKNPFLQRVWPLDMPTENELKMVRIFKKLDFAPHIFSSIELRFSKLHFICIYRVTRSISSCSLTK